MLCFDLIFEVCRGFNSIIVPKEQPKRRAGKFTKTPEDSALPDSTAQDTHSSANFHLPNEQTTFNYLDLIVAARNARNNSSSQSNYAQMMKLHGERIMSIRQRREQSEKTATQLSNRKNSSAGKPSFAKRRLEFENSSKFHLDHAINNLHNVAPQYSSRRTFTPAQIVVFTILVITLFVGWGFDIAFIDKATAIFLSVFYLASVLCRVIILANYNGKTNGTKTADLEKIPYDTLPGYSVVVALYKEESQVEALCHHLSKLKWPKGRLEIKLICEADDAKTIHAIQQLGLPDYFDLIVVPNAEPKTKPKALNYALPLCIGKYLVLYDAEDQPDPYQLLEAYHKFEHGNPALLCLQAPLHIYNRNQTWLTRMFAIEYCTQFEGILPVLERWQMPIPLGGTSNHFKLKELKELGAWDPYNVTEDADLGIRISRAGYLCGTLTRPTHEESPPTFSVWLPQRTRWIKGWMQTILVHSRSPRLLLKQIGWKSFCMFHLLITSVALSSLIHPFFLITAISELLPVAGQLFVPAEAALRMVSIFILVCGYLAYGLLAFSVLRDNKLPNFSVYLLTLPLYWVLISIAGWRALYQLLFNPHFWEKTTHGLANHPKATTLDQGHKGF